MNKRMLKQCIICLIVFMGVIACEPPDEPINGTSNLADEILHELESNLSLYVGEAESGKAVVNYQKLYNIDDALNEAEIRIMVEGARQEIKKAGKENSNNLKEVLPQAMKGAEQSLNGINKKTEDKEQALRAAQSSLMESINKHQANLPEAPAEKKQALKETVQELAQQAVSNLDEAGIPQESIERASTMCSQTAVINLPQAGIKKEDAGEAMAGIMKGSVGGLNQITSINTAQVKEFVGKIAGESAKILDELNYLDVSSGEKQAMMGCIVEGAMQGIKEEKGGGLSYADFKEMAGNIAREVVGAVDEVEEQANMVSFIEGWVPKVAEAAINALEKEEDPALNMEAATDVVSEIAAGAVSGLKQINEIALEQNVKDTLIAEIAKKSLKAMEAMESVALDNANVVYVVSMLTRKIKTSIILVVFDQTPPAGYMDTFRIKITEAVLDGLSVASGLNLGNSEVYNSIITCITDEINRPELLSPLGDTSEQKPVFRWLAPTGPTTAYWLIVANIPDFDSPETIPYINEKSLSSTSYTSTVTFSPGTYYWKVKYIVNGVGINWSVIASFTVK